MALSQSPPSVSNEDVTALRVVVGVSGTRELLLATAGDRVARLAVTDGELFTIAPVMLRMGLEATRSPRRFVSRPDRGKGGFSNRFASRHPQRHPEARWLLYVARRRELAEHARRAEAGESVDGFGQLLKYPTCCTEWYQRTWPIAEAHHQGDLFPLAHKSSAPLIAGHALLNFGANYFGGGWASFFACSLTCRDALAVIDHDRKVIQEIAPSIAHEADLLARLPVVYTEYRGIAQLTNSTVDSAGGVIMFDPDTVTVTEKPPLRPLWRKLLTADAVRPIGISGFELFRGHRLIHRERTMDAFVRWFDWI